MDFGTFLDGINNTKPAKKGSIRHKAYKFVEKTFVKKNMPDKKKLKNNKTGY